MIIRILYFKKIVKNSTISIVKCISTGLRICRSYGIALFINIPGIYYEFERKGHSIKRILYKTTYPIFWSK